MTCSASRPDHLLGAFANGLFCRSRGAWSVRDVNRVDGTYSIAISGLGGSAAGFVCIRDGRLTGNDSLGAEYSGIASRNQSGSVTLRFDIVVPPGSFAVWNGAFAQDFMKQSIEIRVPGRVFERGEPHFFPTLLTWIIFSKNHEGLRRFAGPEGRLCQANLLLEADYAWRNADRDRLQSDWNVVQSIAPPKAAE